MRNACVFNLADAIQARVAYSSILFDHLVFGQCMANLMVVLYLADAMQARGGAVDGAVCTFRNTMEKVSA